MNATKTTTLIDYGLGNIRAFYNIFKRSNLPVKIASSRSELINADKLILPGVGSFDTAISRLNSSGMRETLDDLVLSSHVPVLGICVGMQMLGIESEESKNTKGLGVIKFEVSKIKGKRGLKVPHVGWNEVKFSKKFGSFEKNKKYDFYFDHSYSVEKSIFSIGKTCHSHYFESIINYKNILACQFHPEKSQENGLEFLKTFFSTYA